MKIAIASDHAGFDMKSAICTFLRQFQCEIIDFGPSSTSTVDYPDYGKKVSELVSKGEIEKGILICGTGIGMSIVANKYPNIRAALCSEPFSAKMSRLHNDSNILVLGGRIIGIEMAKEIVSIWLNTPFEGGRHCGRLYKICLIENTIYKGGAIQ